MVPSGISFVVVIFTSKYFFSGFLQIISGMSFNVKFYCDVGHDIDIYSDMSLESIKIFVS